MNELTTKGNKHTHIRVQLKHMNGKLIHEYKTVHSFTAPVAAMTVISENDFEKYNLNFAKDKEGDTEYFIINGVILDDIRLTAHVFSCYCEPLNENQEPPF